MPFSRARYVTLCQQSLVTAAVLALGVSAAGVKTLDIVPQPGPAAGAQGTAPGVLPQDALADHVGRPPKTEVDTAPVTPKVREVKVSGISTRTAATPASPKAPERAPATKAPQKAPAPSAERVVPPTTNTKSAVPAKRMVALSDPQPVRGYATVGVTWEHGVQYAENQLAVQVRTEKQGTWSGWMTVAYHDDHGPDGGSSEEEARNERPGTDALVIGDVDFVQMRAQSSNGVVPPDLKLAVIDPGTGTLVKAAPAIDTSKLPSSDIAPASAEVSTTAAASAAQEDGQDTAALSAMKVAPKPYIYSRAQWGANERLRDQTAPSYGTVQTGFIHHTVNANNYTEAQVPALLRGIYAYHTQSRGWRDIGYNYLVDRFGRIWEGRYGGVTRAVVGAHTLGYNEVSFAMSAIGNYDITAPSQAVLNAYASLFAWKLSLYNIRADTPRIWVKGKYLQAINGHRDVGQTACPGRYLYAKIPSIRDAAQRIQNAAQTGTTAPPVTPPTPPAAPTPNADGFATPTQTPRAATTQPSPLAFPRSLNLVGDANPDLALKSSTGQVRIFQTGGQTGFKAPVSTRGNWAAYDKLVAVGDVTGDGRGDVLARARSGGSARVYRGDGAGHVLFPAIGATYAFRSANMITSAGDWNRDGRNDVLMRDTRGWLFMLPGKGAGRFGKPVLLSKFWRGFSTTAVAGDLTGDGRVDIVGTRGNGYVYTVANRKAKRLRAAVSRYYVGKNYTALVGAGRDMTGDGYGDAVLRAPRTGQVIILPGTSRGFGSALGPFDAAKGLTRLSTGQMAGGAQPDVVGTNGAGTQLLVAANNGLTNLRPSIATNLTQPGITQVLNAGDWNHDGIGDLITRESAGDALVLRPGAGNGLFRAGVLMGRGWRTITNLAAVGDVTGDKLPDLVGKTAAGKTTIFPGNGAASFKATVLAPNYLKSFNQVGIGSWQPQLFPGSAYVSSDGSFVPFRFIGAGDLAGYDWVIGPGDVDGDGHNDLVVRDAGARLWLLPGTLSGYGTRRLIASGFSGYTLGG
ncbi:MAG: N-acetylmuramoyl-L-alanine amidase, family 2 [Marmoricola sp.]|nr:N-acetylmuramoyl-L-alanine amidase, family 2 [Marmoricola sp.]